MSHVDEYSCVFCPFVKGEDSELCWSVTEDIFYRDDLVVCFIAGAAIKGNEGHALIVPTGHYKSIYDLPEEVGHRVFDLSKKIAIALKETYGCDGVKVVQNNDAAGDQHVFHYHMHVVPRYEGDHFQEEEMKAEKSEPEDRAPYAKKLREYFENL